jgi:PleD family two-component response regulator
MGGTVIMDSAPGKGTTMSVTLTLPVAQTPPPRPDTNASRATIPVLPAVPFDAPLVLAVDDHPTNRPLLARQLAALGMRVKTAANGKEALAL